MRVFCLVVALGLAASPTAFPPAAASASSASAAVSPDPRIVIKDGRTQPVFSYQSAIRETVYVEVPTDSDHDGKNDRVAVHITRPRPTAAGMKVASIIEASPYFGGTLDIPYHPVDVTDRPRLAPWSPPKRPWKAPDYGFVYYDNYFVPRGYAVLAVSTLGTGESTGCPGTVGPDEATAMKTVVQWLTGDATAVHGDGTPATATWSAKKVAMAGKSYDGTLPLAAAATGVKGLKTVVSISGVADWYEYYRANGGVVAPGGYPGEDADLHAKIVLTRKNPEVCARAIHDLEARMDRTTGDDNAFWRERDFAAKTAAFKASVFVVGGLNDWNVKPNQFLNLWQALKSNDVPRKLWIHQARHDDPIDVRGPAWLDTLNRWFAHWLYCVPNGITEEPKVDLERDPGHWTTEADWPARKARTVSYRLPRGEFRDQPSRTAERLAAEPDRPDPNRMIFLTPPLKRAERLSGIPRIRLDAATRGPGPYLTALIVDYGQGDHVKGLAPTGTSWCFGDSAPGDPGCRQGRHYLTKPTRQEIVTRGWIDVRNRLTPWRTDPVTPGRTYAFSWPLVPYDHVFKPGHRIGLVIIGTDHDYTLRYPPGTTVTVSGGELSLPLAAT
jgi:X-Pro dipeptidyl-peptidase